MTVGPIDTVVFDLDGVLYRGDNPIPGVGEVVSRLASTGTHILFATNNSTTEEPHVAANIARRTGFAAVAEQVITSGYATARALRGEVQRVYVIGGAGLAVVLEREGISITGDWRTVDAVVVGLDRDISYPKLVDATAAVRGGARLVATNHDPTYPTPNGLAPGAGSIVAALETATGQPAEVMGKPHAPFASVVKERASGRIAVVGDRIDSDMALARNNGWPAILVLTGVTDREEAAAADVDVVLESAAELERVLG